LEKNSKAPPSFASDPFFSFPKEKKVLGYPKEKKTTIAFRLPQKKKGLLPKRKLKLLFKIRIVKLFFF